MPTMTQAGYTPPKQAPKKTPPPPKRVKKKKKGRKRKRMSGAAAASLVIFALAAAAGAGTLYVYAQTQPYQHTFLPGTILMGYPLTGATREDAQKLLDTIDREYVDTWRYEIDCMGRTYTLTAQDVGLSIDREASLAQLWSVGHEGGMLARFADMQRLKKEALVLPYPVLDYDLSAVEALLERIRADVECEAVEATVSFAPGDATPFAFTPEREGYALDVSGVQADVEQAIERLTPGSMSLTPQTIEPTVRRLSLEANISLRSRLVTQVSGDAATLQNVKLAAQALNGLQLDRGETLSFNEAVGARTEENGYLVAEEPAYGEGISGVGGGVCQVSTALYRAALLAGLDVKERNAAVRPVAYCDMGQEAAVSDQGLDLTIANPTSYPLFMTARTYEESGETMLEIMLMGEPLGKRYRLHSLIDETEAPQEPVYVRDRTGQYATYTDERVPVGEALPGYAVSVERVVIEGDGLETDAEIVSESVYEAAAPTIYVGMQERDGE